MIFNLLFFIFVLICCSDIKEEINKNKEKNNNNNLSQNNKIGDYYKENPKRELSGDFESIRICLEMKRLEEQMSSNNNLPFIKEALNASKETLQKLIKVKRLSGKYTIPDDIKTIIIDNDFKWSEIENSWNKGYPCDLIIFIRDGDKNIYIENQIFSIPEIISTISSTDDNDGRPIVGTIKFNSPYMNKYISKDNKERLQALKIIFMHEITHILGFERTIFNNKNLLSTHIPERINNGEKTIFIGSKVLSLAKKYFACDSMAGLELDTKNYLEGDNFFHWEGRLLLGDYMTADIYYPDQFISEFTLYLLEDLGWYQINNYTGGLMKFGKNKGCNFIFEDCVNIGTAVTSRFPNEFCIYPSYGTCSPGRQSRGYCYSKTDYSDVEYPYRRDGWRDRYGVDKVEYCPITKQVISKFIENYYVGNCNFGNSSYGDEIEDIEVNYVTLSKNFAEQFGSNSFCALSSIKKKQSNIDPYEGYIRPTCYPMFCSEKSLTIQINEEYIVCPRQGGIIKIENKEYTNYTGYLFCPDYNLICTGTKMCNDLFDCVEKESSPKEYSYNYPDYNNITSHITENIRTEDKLEELEIEGYELSEDNNTICPVNCRQCISNKRCTLCKNMTNSEPHAFYIGSVDDEQHNITCSSTKPSEGYYNVTKYGNPYFFFECTPGCVKCTKATKCDICVPKKKLIQIIIMKLVSTEYHIV